MTDTAPSRLAERRETPPDVVVDPAHNGPPDSGNGGWCCGLFAAAVTGRYPGRAAVTLHAPPPLGVPLAIRPGPRRALVEAPGPGLVATVTGTRSEIPLVPPVSVAEAERARGGYLGLEGSPFPTCFVCGTERTAADGGLGLTPGLIGPGAVACTWTPAGPVGEGLMWAVLDCPGGWTADHRQAPMVLQRMTAEVGELPEPGEPVVLVAHTGQDDGVTCVSDSAAYDRNGRPLARARSLWARLGSGAGEGGSV